MAANRIQLQSALQKPYDRILFSREVLSPIFGSEFTLSSSLVPTVIEPNKSESATIDKVWIYGKILLDDSTEVTCYEVRLQPTVRIEQSKVAIQHYVRKLLTAGQAALINFVAPANNNIWRLTLVAKDSVLTDKGVKEKITNAKRYTFLLGPSETCKTAAERFEVLSTEKEITFQSLIDAFSVEKLSKAFFNEYTLHYQNFCDYLQESNYCKSVFNISFPANATKQEKDKASKPIRDFVKKFLGRIVFLYFVQKKGWLGASDTNYTNGLSDFIKQLFDKSGGNDAFYNNWLTALFFDTLNKERTNDDFKMPDGETVKVPFLNGGLFDKEEFDEHFLTFPAKLFHHPDFEDAILTVKNIGFARGFLDFLDAFNFTIYEDSPDDHTVAVDPEMLGHIFENLLEDNKDKGVFYTPKEIVHYMCQESLTEYLCTALQLRGDDAECEAVSNLLKNKEIDKVLKPKIVELEKALNDVKICDPAIGSGAFPMGLLQEIFSVKELIAYETDKEWKPAEAKLNIIQNSIYGVDIEKGAVDIARLRFWLSLVVDEEKPKALPNLDYKIVVGDSLISKFEDEIIEVDWEIMPESQTVMYGNEYLQNRKQLLQALTDKQRKYFEPTNKSKKALALEIRNQKIDVLVNQLELMIKTEGLEEAPISANFKYKKRFTAAHSLYMKTKGWKEAKKVLLKLKQQPDKPFNHFDWKLNFPEVLNPYLVNGNGGFDIVIANPPYVDIKNLPPELVDVFFEKFKTTKNRINLYSIFIEKGWELTNSNGYLCYINPNSLLLNSSYKKTRKLIVKGLQKIIKLPDDIFINAIVETIIVQAKRNSSSEYVLGSFYKNNENIDFGRLNFKKFFKENWLNDDACRFNIFISPEANELLKQIENSGVNSLDNYFEITLGITPYDKYKGHSKKLIKERGFHSKTKIDKFYVPLITGANILKYFVDDTVNEYLKYGDWLGAPRQKKFFTSPRVIVRQIISGNPPCIYAGYTEKELYHTQIGFSIIKKEKSEYSTKLLCAFLNSSVLNFYHKYKYTDPEKNVFQKILIENCKKFPLKKINLKPIIILIEHIVDYIIFLKSHNIKNVNNQLIPTYFEQIIDGMVYELYFPELLKKHKREIIKHLGELPKFSEDMNDEQKLRICKNVFNRLNNKEHPVRVNLFFMNSIPEIAIIEGRNENN